MTLISAAADRTERAARIVHLALLAAVVTGLAAWLWRVYNFEPLTVKEPLTAETPR